MSGLAYRVDLGEVGLGPHLADEFDVRARLPIRIARGEGVVLQRGLAPFHEGVGDVDAGWARPG